mmetsp:Transcript_9145/g.19456  ORF Transcript_9145/g.19456 Transcript_9145/m.19456 type:complete len:441 (-) Transcript_9145:136-1458(-)
METQQLEDAGNKDEEREETVGEKIDRLGKEVEDLREQVKEMLGLEELESLLVSLLNISTITTPPVPEPLLKLRHAIKEKDMEREVLLEEQRASKAVEEYLQENPSILEKVDDCPICLDPIFDVSPTLGCCGKEVCHSCLASIATKVNNTCPLCRGKFMVAGEPLSYLRDKAAEGKAWAQCLLGTCYDIGVKGLAVDEEKAESLFRSAADQGDPHAQYCLASCELERNNDSEACRLYEAAASQGHMSALGRLGSHYFLGDGVEKDEMKGLRLLTISAKLQSTDVIAHSNLGKCFAYGEGGLERSFVRSAHYLKIAVERNELDSEEMELYASLLLMQSKYYYPDYEIPPSGHNTLPEALFWYRRADVEAIRFAEYESKIKKLCACCYKPFSTDKKAKCCVECRAVYYCSRECQVADWKAGHKKDCTKALKKRLRATGEFSDI